MYRCHMCFEYFISVDYTFTRACTMNVGFTAVDLTVACMTEVMWMFVLLDNSLLEMVFDYTLKFILSPVRIFLSVWTLPDSSLFCDCIFN